MHKNLFTSRVLTVDGLGKKRVFAPNLTTQPTCSIFHPVHKLPTFTPSPAHLLQVTIHYKNRFFSSVNPLLLPTIHTPNKSNNKLNISILLRGDCV